MTKPTPTRSTSPAQVATPRPKLDDEAFEAFIRKRHPAAPVWSMSGLDGYLTALIIGPKFINPYQWIPLFAGEGSMALPMETTEHQAVQTIVAEYNRISATLGERPEEYRPRFSNVTYSHDSFDWHTGFLLGTEFAPSLWNPVIRGHAVTGDIIAAIRALCDAKKITTPAEIIQIAGAVIRIRDYFMPRRAKQKF